MKRTHCQHPHGCFATTEAHCAQCRMSMGADDKGPGWTEERVGEAVRLWKAGLSASQIAKQIGGVSRNGVIGKMHRLGLSHEGPNRTRAPQQRATPRSSEATKITITLNNRLRHDAPPRLPRVPAPKPRPVPVAAVPRPLTALGRGHCRWPLDMSLVAEATALSLFCAAPIKGEGCAYCPDHARAAYPDKKPEPINLSPSTDRRRFNGRHFRTGNASPRFAE